MKLWGGFLAIWTHVPRGGYGYSMRLPAFYVYENDGWLHCRGCHVGVIAAEGTAPIHAAGCEVADMEKGNG